MRSATSISEAVARLKVAFLEMPGTKLTVADASRLCGLDRETCGLVLAALEDAGFVTRSRFGLFVRRGDDSPLAN